MTLRRLKSCVAPFECLFCRRRDASFKHIEHPIPESLGNDDLILPRGWVCDQCNAYFGSKVEEKALQLPPFNIERTAYSVKTKKGKFPRHKGSGYSIGTSGAGHGRVNLIYEGNMKALENIMNTRVLVPAIPPGYDTLMARFLTKLGTELLLAEGCDAYESHFRAACRCARFGEGATNWDVGYGVYPRRADLLLARFCEGHEEVSSHQLYRYELGMMPSGDVMLSFMYGQVLMACNLSRPPATEYILAFNQRNDFTVRSRWNY